MVLKYETDEERVKGLKEARERVIAVSAVADLFELWSPLDEILINIGKALDWFADNKTEKLARQTEFAQVEKEPVS